jgi:uncharacterized protein YjbJ (UPF0337 family)
MNNEEKKGKAEQAKGKVSEEGKATVTEKQRFKGKMDKTENKARAAAGKARRKKQGHEAVSDQKSHEFH